MTLKEVLQEYICIWLGIGLLIVIMVGAIL